MSTAVKLQEVKIKDITVTEDAITAQLIDGRIISVPLAWSWRLSEAAMAYIGLISMRISALKVCFTVFRLLAFQDKNQNHNKGKYWLTNHSRKPEVAASLREFSAESFCYWINRLD